MLVLEVESTLEGIDTTTKSQLQVTDGIAIGVQSAYSTQISTAQSHNQNTQSALTYPHREMYKQFGHVQNQEQAAFNKNLADMYLQNSRDSFPHREQVSDRCSRQNDISLTITTHVVKQQNSAYHNARLLENGSQKLKKRAFKPNKESLYEDLFVDDGKENFQDN